MKTPQEISQLKSNWYADSCWDIEETEGFEDHYEELLQYRLETEAERKSQSDLYWQQESEKFGIPGNIELTRYIKRLEYRISQIEEWRSEMRS